MNQTETKTDVYDQVTAAILDAIETGTTEYRMPWHCCETPMNAFTRKRYRGVNTLMLWVTGARRGYRSPKWATYRQWSEAGAQVRKGEKSTTVVFWKFFDGTETESDDNAAEPANRSVRCFARAYNVFNANQVEGFEDIPQPVLGEGERLLQAELFFQRLPGTVHFGGDRAYYSPATDSIQMPPFSQFQSASGYVSVLAHERVHWSGAKHRLNRDLSGRFGTEQYAMEELIAELGASFLCATLGVESKPRTDHAPYIANWLAVLRNDKRAIFSAASKAQEAAEYLGQLAGISQERAS